MKNHLDSHKAMSRLCAELSDDDGLNHHAALHLTVGRAHRRDRPAAGLDRKVIQLCHQVAETLDEVLADCGDGFLQALRVVDVEPAPNASRLLVTMAVDGLPGERLDMGRVHDHLSRASGHLRSEVATAITRKRAPVLVYRLAVRPGETT
jgi:ribosome-binding factor A